MSVQFNHTKDLCADFIREGANRLSASITGRVMQVANNKRLQTVASNGYKLYSLICTYPNQPLWAFSTSLVAATNFFLPKTLSHVTKNIPTWLKSGFVFNVTKKQLVLEVAIATLFIGAIALIPEEYKVSCSLILMGVLPHFAQSLDRGASSNY